MKRVTVRLFVEDPVTHAFVPIASADDSAQVKGDGSVLARDTEFGTWRRLGSVSERALVSIMRGEAREPWATGGSNVGT